MDPYEQLRTIAPGEGESLDDFMTRTAGLQVSRSLRRVAWGTGRSLGELVEKLDGLRGGTVTDADPGDEDDGEWKRSLQSR